MTTRSLIHAVIVSVFMVVGWIGAEPLPAAREGTGSKPAGNLTGRLFVAEKKIKPSGCFLLTLELRNVGAIPLKVETGNPFAFTVRVEDGAGKPVDPTLSRSDVIYSPQWAIVSNAASLGLPVSIQSADGATGSQLDITTLIWKLPSGKYRIHGEYSSESFAEITENSITGTVWRGKLILPALDVEIE